MIGKSDMTLYGWKQLIEWSLEHACLSKEEYHSIHGEWAKRWDKFLDEVTAELGYLLRETTEAGVEAGAAVQ